MWANSSDETMLSGSPPHTARYKVYKDRILADPDNSFVKSNEEALERMMKDPKLLYFTFDLAFLSEPRVVR